MIDDRTRAILLTVAAVACSIAACLLPVAGESALQIHTAQQTFDARLGSAALPAPPDDPLPARDPFAPDSVQSAPVGRKAAPVLVAVRAVIAGSDARALIEEAGRMRIVQIGDRVAASTVRAITARGITLADGTAVQLEAMP